MTQTQDISNQPSHSPQSPECPPNEDDEHAHHIHEFGEVEKLVHVKQRESSVEAEQRPVAPVSNKSRAARHNRWSRLRGRLFRRRHLMQYFYNGILYRTNGLRKVTTEELFLDLVIVAAVAALGHELRETEISWSPIEKFILLFNAVYASWRHIVVLWNLYGVHQDIPEKMGIYVSFLALTGVALGAHDAFVDKGRPFVAISAFIGTITPLLGQLAFTLKEPLLKNPHNRVNQVLVTTTTSIIATLPYFAAAFVGTESATKALYWTAFGMEVSFIFIPYQIHRFLHRNISNYTRGAINIELFVEKFEVLTMIVMGETMIGLLFEAGSVLSVEESRIGFMYLSAMAATITLYSLQTLYVQVDNRIQKGGTHAIRHKLLTSFSWSILHLPYHFFLVMFATGLSISLRDVAVPPIPAETARFLLRAANPTADAEQGAAQFTRNARWLYSVGWGGSVIFSGLISGTHHGGPRSATKRWRLAGRILFAAGFMVGMPFTELRAEWFQLVIMGVSMLISAAEYVLVHMDRIGFFRSEASMQFSSGDSSSDYRGFVPKFDESDSDSIDLDIGTQERDQGPSHPDEVDLEIGEGQKSADMHCMELKQRLCKGHQVRLVPVKKDKTDKHLAKAFG
eukprot:GFKZ01015760.1.p1 GENE.GFKZ01015760.1~~GFKZ01015760.1.p1  ORF type:complete len:625 (-),score=65.08 GFKZ01015760.1:570-2444(-)